MSRSRLHGKLVAGLAAGTMLVALSGVTPPPAGADPAFVSSYTAVGSDTTMSVIDALAGSEPYAPWTQASPANIYYLPIHSDLASGQKVLSSFDAVPQGGSSASPGCITTRLGGPSFDRPDGSGNGISALSHSIDGTGWNSPTASASCTGTPTVISGQLDFARSSRGPNNVSTNALTFIPFGRDAVSYAYLKKGSAAITALTTAQLKSLYTSPTGTITVGSDTVKACLANTGSGTTGFWVKAIGVTVAQATSAATAAGCFTAPGLEEHDGNAFFAKANSITAAGQDAVIDFSVGNWIAQANGAAVDRSATARANGVDLGNIDGIGGVGAKPYTGSGSNLAPNATYYNFVSPTDPVGTYGRNVYNVVQTSRIGTFGDAGLKSLFVGTGSAICASGAQATVQKFGFQSISSCGSTALTGALYS